MSMFIRKITGFWVNFKRKWLFIDKKCIFCLFYPRLFPILHRTSITVAECDVENLILEF